MADKQSLYLKFIEQGMEIAKAIPEYFSKFSNKIFSNHQKIILLVLKQKLRTTYRDLVEFLKISQIPQIIGLKRIPHFTTLIRFSKKVSKNLLNNLLGYCIKFSKKKSLKLAVDATGFELDRASQHYAKIRFLDVKKKKIIQLTACATTDTQLITSIRVEKRKSVVSKKFIDVVKESSKFGKIKIVTADKGYDSNKNHEYLIRTLKIKSGIKVREKALGRRSTLRKRILKTFNEEIYHQRSKIETIFSVIKRKYDSKIKAKQTKTQIQESMQKTLTYNIDRLAKLISLLIRGFHQSRAVSP